MDERIGGAILDEILAVAAGGGPRPTAVQRGAAAGWVRLSTTTSSWDSTSASRRWSMWMTS